MSQNNSLNPTHPERRLISAAGEEGYDFDLFRSTSTNPTAVSIPSAHIKLEVWRLTWRRKGILFLFCLFGAIGSVLLTLKQTPRYEAQATLEIQSPSDNSLRIRETGNGSDSASNTEYDLQTQLRVLQSESLLERVISKLNLETRLLPDPRLSLGWLQFMKREALKPFTREQALMIAASQARRNLKIRARANTRIVEISYQAAEPRLAADFVNTLANEFIQQDLEARWQMAEHNESFFRNQLGVVKKQLAEFEKQLQNYGNDIGLLFSSQKEDVVEDKLRQLQQELLKARADRVVKQSSYLMASESAPDSLPAVLDDPTLKEYHVKLTDLKRQLAELDTTLTPTNPKVKKAQSQIAALEVALAAERENIVRRVHNEYVAAQRREQMFAADYVSQGRLVSAQAAKVARYNIIKRDVDTNRQLYDSMLQRVKETGIVAALRASNIRVIDPAQPPPFPVARELSVNAVLGSFGGGLLGLALVVIRQRVNRKIQEPGDSLSYLKSAEIGIIPSNNFTRSWRLLRGKSDSQADRRDLALVMQRRAGSPMAVSFRMILTTLLFARGDGKAPKVIVVSSANPSEGKTTIICNLAIALARVNKRVALVDGDLRAPGLHEIFEIGDGVGLSDALVDPKHSEGQPLRLRETSIPNLSLVTRGTVSGEDLVYASHLPGIINQLRNQFDAVLIDSPPVLYAPEARVFGQLADAVIMVLRAGQTTRDAAQLAFNRFHQDGIPIFGTILNDWNPRRTTAYGYEVYGSKQYYDCSHRHGAGPMSFQRMPLRFQKTSRRS